MAPAMKLEFTYIAERSFEVPISTRARTDRMSRIVVQVGRIARRMRRVCRNLAGDLRRAQQLAG